MKRYLIAVAVLSLPISIFAQSGKPCEELKAEISKKIEANQVKSFTLEIVPKDKEVQGKVVGTCEGGTKKIVYTRTMAAPQKGPEQTKKP